MAVKAKGGPVIKRNKNAAKKVVIAIMAPTGADFVAAGTTIKTVVKTGSTDSWDPKTLERTADRIVIELTGKKDHAIKPLLDPPDTGTLTVTLTNPPTNVEPDVVIPVVFVDDIP
jgi:hypothetical protein